MLPAVVARGGRDAGGSATPGRRARPAGSGQTGSRRCLGGGVRRAELARRGAGWGRGASREHGRAGASHSVELGLVPKTCDLVTGDVSGLHASIFLASKQLTAGRRAKASARRLTRQQYLTQRSVEQGVSWRVGGRAGDA